MFALNLKYITFFTSLCLGLSFSVQAQKNGVLVAKEGTFSDFVLTNKVIQNIRGTEENKEEMPEFYSVPADGSGSSSELSAVWVEGAALPFSLNPTEEKGQVNKGDKQVIYQSSQPTGKSKLYSISASGFSNSTSRSNHVEIDDVVRNFTLSKNKEQVVYLSKGVEGIPVLYANASDGTTTPTRISGKENVQTYDISRDGKTIVYVAEKAGKHELYANTSDGLSNSQKISGQLVENGNVMGDFYLTKNGKSVIFRADADRNNIFELYRVPIDGSSKPIKISSKKLIRKSVGAGFRLSKDEKWIIYRAKGYAHRSFQLYSASADGSSETPTELSAGDVKKFRINHEANTVIYLASEYVSNQFDLYSSSFDDADKARMINTKLVEGGTVKSFRLGANGDRIVYRAAQETKDLFELYTASLKDTTSLQKVSLPLEEGKRIRSFILAKSGKKLIYTADYKQINIFELYATTFDDKTETIKLNDPLLAGESINKFRLSRDEDLVIYQAKQKTKKDKVYTKIEESEDTSLANARTEESENDKDLVSNAANIYPNPASDVLFVRFAHLNQATYSVTDGQGRLILEGELVNGRTSIDIENFAEGAYQLSIHDGLKVITKKFIKK